MEFCLKSRLKLFSNGFFISIFNNEVECSIHSLEFKKNENSIFEGINNDCNNLQSPSLSSIHRHQ